MEKLVVMIVKIPGLRRYVLQSTENSKLVNRFGTFDSTSMFDEDTRKFNSIEQAQEFADKQGYEVGN